MNAIELFKTIAQIDSTSGNEQEVAAWIMNFLKDLGLNPTLDENGMVYCRIGNGENPKLFCAHMDTVEPGRNIQVIEKDGFLVSAGDTIIGGDDKVSVATILYSVKKLLDEGKNLNIELLFTVREETDSGVQLIDIKMLQSKVCFVFDGGNGDLTWLAQKAPNLDDFKIDIVGKSAHAGRPELGINALQVLINLKDKIILGQPDQYSTLNIGLIQGGNATNTVPEKIRLEGDLRSTSIESFKNIKKSFTDAIETEATKLGAKAIVTWLPYSFGFELNKESENYKKLVSLYNGQGIELQGLEVKGGSDAGFLNSIGIESFCLGDGVIDPHSTNERIEITKLNKLQEIVENLMLEY